MCVHLSPSLSLSSVGIPMSTAKNLSQYFLQTQRVMRILFKDFDRTRIYLLSGFLGLSLKGAVYPEHSRPSMGAQETTSTQGSHNLVLRPSYGGYQKSYFVGSLCLCDLLGPYSMCSKFLHPRPWPFPQSQPCSSALRRRRTGTS